MAEQNSSDGIFSFLDPVTDFLTDVGGAVLNWKQLDFQQDQQQAQFTAQAAAVPDLSSTAPVQGGQQVSTGGINATWILAGVAALGVVVLLVKK